LEAALLFVVGVDALAPLEVLLELEPLLAVLGEDVPVVAVL